MRSSWRWALSLVLVCGLGGGRAVALDFHDPRGGWSITLPPGWTPLSEEEKADVLVTLRQSLPGVQLTAAFRRGDGDLPYLLATEHALKNASLDRVAKARRAAKPLERTDVQLDPPEVDERRQMVVLRSRTSEVQSLTALFPGRDNLVELIVVVAADAPEGDLAAFEAITRSFRFDAGRGYAPKADRSLTILLGLVVVIVSGLVRAYRRREQRRPRDLPGASEPPPRSNDAPREL